MEKIFASLKGVGMAVGENTLTNADLEKMVETSDEWIITRTGIKTRQITNKDTFSSDLATRAAIDALKMAGMNSDELDMIIVSCVTGDSICPSTSCVVQSKIGAVNAFCMDINVACTGFVAGVATASKFIESGTYKKILVIGSECLSKVTDYKDRGTCILFGDGAGAAIFTAGETGVLSTYLGSDGTQGDVLTLPFLKIPEKEMERRISKNPYTLWMDGGAVMKFAVRIMVQSINKVLDDSGLSLDDIALIVPHQANTRILDGAIKRLKIDSGKVFSNIYKYGNMSSASIGVAMCEAMVEGKMKKGDKVIIVGFGAGLTWGAVLLEV